MKILISGITGQDGSILARQLLEKGNVIYGIARRSSSRDFWRINDFINNKNFRLLYGDITDIHSIQNIFKEHGKFDQCYHLAAQSFVGISWKNPISTLNINIIGTANMLEACRLYCPEIHFYNAASSEMYGKVLEIPQKETTPFNPISPYGISKVDAFFLTKCYRESYQMFCSSGILFNHESEFRGEEFVTRKICIGAVRSKKYKEILKLGNINAKRDWGLAHEYTNAMQLILNHKYSDDFVISTGETHTVQEFVELAYKLLDLNWKDWVQYDQIENLRLNDVNLLIGDSSKAKKELNWKAEVKFENLVDRMIKYEIDRQ